MTRIRKTILYSGSVQGVGFRATAQSAARGRDVTGYVRNTPDGRVELVAEGEPRELEAFADDVSRRMSGHIREARADESEASGAFEGFGVRH